VCICACKHACMCNLPVVIYPRGLVICGVANSSSPGPSHVVETRLPYSWPCKPTTGLPMHHTLNAMDIQYVQMWNELRNSGPCFCPLPTPTAWSKFKASN